MGRTGVVLTNLGGPDEAAAIEPFLVNLFSDPAILSIRPAFLRRFVARRIARKRAPKVEKDYATIGGKSPLPDRTEAQRRALVDALEVRAPGRFAAAVAMRYWRPFTEEAVHALTGAGCDRFLHLPLYPQRSKATTDSSSLELRRVLRGARPDAPFAEVSTYATHPGYVAAVRATVVEGLVRLKARGGTNPHVLFSAHGLPERFRKAGDPYVGEIEATKAAVCQGLSEPSTLSFQSRVGPVAWVRPYTDETIVALARSGVTSLLIVPLGFVSDHFETLFEIDRLYVDLARRHGMEHVLRAPSLNDRREFIQTLCDLTIDAAEAGGWLA